MDIEIPGCQAFAITQQCHDSSFTVAASLQFVAGLFLFCAQICKFLGEIH